MGCTQSHPESKIYEYLENLNLSFTDQQISDDVLAAKIEKILQKIEIIIEHSKSISPFVRVEVQICKEGLQKSRPRLFRTHKQYFQKTLDKADLACAKRPETIRRAQDYRDGKGKICESASTVLPTPDTSKRTPMTLGRQARNFSDSTQRCSSTVRSSLDREEDCVQTVKLKSLYQNTMNCSQETLDEYGFFEVFSS